MPHTGIIESFFYIFAGAAVLATFALYTRQPMLVAYIVLGCLLGPFGGAYVSDPKLLSEIAEFGIIFLLFLVGLNLQPSKLKNMVGESLLTALGTTLAFFLIGFGVMAAFGFSMVEAAVTGIAASFSSTILGIKLLPTTALHHRHIGEMVVSLLLIQDLLAILSGANTNFDRLRYISERTEIGEKREAIIGQPSRSAIASATPRAPTSQAM